MIDVLIVDDSAIVRKHLTELLKASGCRVIGTAPNPLFARQQLKLKWPDVIVLDVDMPGLDGISFLEEVMTERPTPVVMCSTLTLKGCETTMRALAAGAVSFVTKPKLGLREFLDNRENGIVQAVKTAACANMAALTRSPEKTRALPLTPSVKPTKSFVVLASSTGGVHSLGHVLQRLPKDSPGLIVVQHMPRDFTASFGVSLNRISAIDVREAKDGDKIISGRALIAPGGRHIRVRRTGGIYTVQVFDGPVHNHHRPSVDVLFKSVALCAGGDASAIVMTGMGDDGARGLKLMRDAGARTAAQDEASSIVYGMPAAAAKLGGAQQIVALDLVAEWILHKSRKPESVRRPGQ